MYRIIFFTFFISQAYGFDAILIGGGGEPDGPTTIFDNTISKLASAQNQLKLNLEVSFDGKHSDTQSKIANELKVSNRPFTAKNYNDLIDSYVSKLKNNHYQAGDQLLLFIENHGAQQEAGQLTHNISIDGQTIQSFDKSDKKSSVSLDKLKELTDLAKSKNIKLGIVDFSCHAGSTLALANENTCVISASGPKHFANGSFSSTFMDELKPGRSLEDVFLATRAEDIVPAFPMISTRAGKFANDQLYELLNPFLNFKSTQNGLVIDKISKYLQEVTEKNLRCQYENNFNRMILELEKLQEQTGTIVSKFGNSQNLLEELKIYKHMQAQYLDRLEKLNLPLLKTKVAIEFKSGKKDKKGREILEKEDISYSDALNLYGDSNITYLTETLKNSHPPDQAIVSSINKHIQIKALREKIKKEHPEFKKIDEVKDSFPFLDKEMWTRSLHIGEITNKLYEKVYANASTDNSREICKDFKF